LTVADHDPGGASPWWTPLRGAELWARVIRVARQEIAFFKFLFESYEGVAIIRTVATLDGGDRLIAILATADFIAETEAILDDVRARGAPAFTSAALPAVCSEDWFLSTWVREAAAD